MPRTSSPVPAARITPADVLRRSLLPIVTLTLILGTTVWGPWVTLGLTAAWWRLVTRCA